jgi:UrcA family protein
MTTAGCALAAPGADLATTDAPRIVLHYDARNLQNPQGLDMLYRRIQSAARQVCPDAAGDPMQLNSAVKSCRAQAIERAVRSIGSSRLAELHEARRGRG